MHLVAVFLTSLNEVQSRLAMTATDHPAGPTRRHSDSLREDSPNRPPIIRLLLLGEASTGKASILSRLIGFSSSIPQGHDPTLEITTYSKLLSFQGQEVEIQCQTHDIDEDYPSYGIDRMVHGFDACIFVYSVSRRSSFETLRKAHDSISEKRGDGAWPRIFIAANKTDLLDEKWEVSMEEGREFSREVGAEFRCFSALEGIGCSEENAVEIVTCIVKHAKPTKESKTSRGARDSRHIACRPDRTYHRSLAVRLKSWRRRMWRRVKGN